MLNLIQILKPDLDFRIYISELSTVMCGQSVNQGANVEFRGRFKWHRLFQIGSGCSLWWAATTAQLRQPACLQGPMLLLQCLRHVA